MRSLRQTIVSGAGWEGGFLLLAMAGSAMAQEVTASSQPGPGDSAFKAPSQPDAEDGAYLKAHLGVKSLTNPQGKPMFQNLNPVAIASTTTLQAIAFKAGLGHIVVTSAHHTIARSAPAKEYVYLGGQVIAVENGGAQ